MQKIKKIIPMLIVATLIVGGSFATRNYRTVSATDTIETKEAPKTVSTVGEAKLSITPDVCVITMGVENKDKDVVVAQAYNAKASDAIVKALESKGIAKADMKTANYDISPSYEYDNKTQQNVQTGYQISNMLTVTIKNLDSVGDIISSVTKNGGNKVSSIKFDVLNKDELYKKALETNSRDKAMLMLSPFGIKSVYPLNIQEQYQTSINEPYYTKALADGVAGSQSIQAGQMEVKAIVNSTFTY